MSAPGLNNPGFLIFEGDTSPLLQWTLIGNDGQPIDLTNAVDVGFFMRLADSEEQTIVGRIAPIASDPTTGVVTYAWQAGDTDVAGNYRAWFSIDWGTGVPPSNAVDSEEFDLQVAIHGPTITDLCTVYDVRQSMRLPAIATGSDRAIQSYITMASNRIQNEFGHFAPYETAVTKRLLMGRNSRVRFFPYFLQSATSVILSPESFALTLDPTTPDYFLDPFVTLEGAYTNLRVSPWIPQISPTSMRFGYPIIQITGNWGYQTVPDAVKLATVLTIRSWMLRDSTAYSATVPSSDPSIVPRPSGTYALPSAAREHLSLFAPTIGIS